ncbi:hypothetical protein [Oryzibacter oryziterrae]|uniref:hypothetical protein n=1 Tax=Oryzibacter oryziterrae TaxID=2766474 RepID=UPI001F403E6A|nr:hypothetical protein [Oryzibacter oryziterrae]
MRLSSRLIGIALATSVSLAGGFAKADTVAAASTAQQVRALAQQGLQPMLHVNLMYLLSMALPSKDTKCTLFGGELARSYRVQSVKGSLPRGLHKSFTIYRDQSCKVKDIVANSVVSRAGSGDMVSANVVLSAKFYGSKGAFGGTLSLSGAFNTNEPKAKFTQTATAKFITSTTNETLALSCDWSGAFIENDRKPIVCALGAAQDLDTIGKNLGTVLSFKLESPSSHGLLSGDFRSSQSERALNVGLGRSVPSVVLKGASTPVSHSTLTATDSGWNLVDKPNDLTFTATSSWGSAFTATIERTSSRAQLATMSVDESGNGIITYRPSNTTARILNWTLAN